MILFRRLHGLKCVKKASAGIPFPCSSTTRPILVQNKTIIQTVSHHRPFHRLRLLTLRYFGSMEWSEKIKSFTATCKNFLQQENLYKSSRATYEILRYLNEWNKIWERGMSDSGHSKGAIVEGESEMDVWRSSMEVVDELAHALLDLKEANMGDEKDRTDYGVILSQVLSMWTKSPPSVDTGIRAQRILDRMEDLGVFAEVREGQKIWEVSYGAVIQAYSITIDDPRGGTINGAIEARNLLEKMESIQGVEPSLRIYNSCIHGFAIRGMIREAEDLLRVLEDRSRSNSNLAPDVLSYSACLNAYSKYSGKVEGKPLAERAEDILHRMLKRYEATGNIRFRPNQYTFGTVIAMMAKGQTPTAAEDADRILQLLIDYSQKEEKSNSVTSYNDEEDADAAEKYSSIQPGVGHFVSVLLAYKQRSTIAAVNRMEELLVQMENMFIAGNDQVKPNYQCFVIYLDALSKINNPEKAEAVLSRIEALFSDEKTFDFNNYGYNLVIDAWARSTKFGRAKRAEAIIQRMQDLSAETGNESLLPDKLTYTCLMTAILTDREAGFEERCAEILSMMETGGERIKPDSYTYTCMVKAYSMANKAELAELVLRRMEKHGIVPQAFCYNSIINAYGKCNTEGSAKKAISILEEMEKHGVKPDIMSYAICIDALGRSNEMNRVKQAEEMFYRCMQGAKDAPNKSILLSSPIFNALQSVYIRSDDPRKAQMTLQVVQLMHEHNIRPTVICYNHVLSACSRVPQDASDAIKKKAFEIAARVLEVLKNDKQLQPNSQSYNSLLWVCNLISDPQEKQDTVKAVFQMCCQDGFLNRKILASVKQVAGDACFYKLLGKTKGHVDITILDPSWSRNAAYIENFSPSRRKK